MPNKSKPEPVPPESGAKSVPHRQALEGDATVDPGQLESLPQTDKDGLPPLVKAKLAQARDKKRKAAKDVGRDLAPDGPKR